jgi:hypothetical protein
MPITESNKSSSCGGDLSFLTKYFVNVPTAITSLVNNSSEEETCSMLGQDYQPSDYDVLCGRGKGSYNRRGNKVFRFIVARYKDQYEASKTKMEKGMILEQVIEQGNGQTKFLKYNNQLKCWTVMSREQAREKIGHVIREVVASGKKTKEMN